MKIPKEYTLLIIIGLFLLAYLLEATVDPLTLTLATPYDYLLSPTYFADYPFTTATIAIRAIALFMTPTFLFSFIKKAHLAKAGTFLIISALVQLYSLQEVVTGTTLVPLEWSLSLSFAGLILLIPTLTHLLAGAFQSGKAKLSGEPYATPAESLEEKPE